MILGLILIFQKNWTFLTAMANDPHLKTLFLLKIKVSWVNATFGLNNSEQLALWGMVWAWTSVFDFKITVWAVKFVHISSYFAHR